MRGDPISRVAGDRSEAPPPEVLAAMAGEEEPTWVNPTAYASCPMCPFLAKAARAVSKVADKVARTTVRRIQSQTRTVASRGTRWTKRNWHKLAPKVKACLATAAFMESAKFLKDGKITRSEWSRYVAFGPRLVPPTETLSIAFPMVFTPSRLVNKAAETAISCGVGAAFGKYFGNGNDGPQPK
jgi:hypothetical protein